MLREKADSFRSAPSPQCLTLAPGWPITRMTQYPRPVPENRSHECQSERAALMSGGLNLRRSEGSRFHFLH